jgi:hypothetical protein
MSAFHLARLFVRDPKAAATMTAPECDKIIEGFKREADRALEIAGHAQKIAADAQILCRAAIAERDWLRDDLLEIANTGADDIDPRLKYVTVQIDRVTWEKLQTWKATQ